MEQYEFEIIKALQQKQDPLVIAKRYNIKLSVVIRIMQHNPELVPDRYKSILGIEDYTEQILEYMKLRKKVATSIPFNIIVAKLKSYLKKPRSSYECMNYVKQPYNRFYAAAKKIGVVRANAMSPLSIDLLISKKAAKRIAKQEKIELNNVILDWRKKQIDLLKRLHRSALTKAHGLDLIPIEDKSLIELIGFNIYTDSLHFVDYLSFVTPVDYFLSFFESLEDLIGKYTNYQKELILGIGLRKKFFDFLGFPKDSAYYSDSPYYPLFLLQNRSADHELVNVGDNMGWFHIDPRLRAKLSIKVSIEEVLDPILMKLAAISMRNLLEKFDPELPYIVKDLCWHKTPIFLELIKYIAYYYQGYHPPDLVDLILNKNILKGTAMFDSEIYMYYYRQMKGNLVDGLMRIDEISFNDIVEALFFNADRYPFAFYLLSRLSGIPTLFKDSEYFLKRMKPRKPTVYERHILGYDTKEA